MNATKEFEVSVEGQSIDFMPMNELLEIVQNVRTICSTVKGTVPLDRELGVDPKVIDEPVNVARAKISSEIIEKVRRFEPRVRVSGVTFEGDMDGHVYPRVRIRIVEGVRT